jgi:hypothetical protein
LYILPLLYMYIFGHRVLISIEVLFITNMMQPARFRLVSKRKYVGFLQLGSDWRANAKSVGFLLLQEDNLFLSSTKQE